MEGSREQLRVRAYLRVLRRRARWIVGTLVLVAGGAALITATQPPQYRANGEVLLGQRASDPAFNVSSGNPEILVNTELGLLRSQRVASKVFSELGPDTPDASFSGDSKSLVIRVSVVDSKPKRAAQTAARYLAVYVEERQEARVTETDQQTELLTDQRDSLRERLAGFEDEIEEFDRQIDAEEDPAERIALANERERRRVDQGVERSDVLTQSRKLSDQIGQLELRRRVLSGGGPQVVSNPLVPTDPFAPNPAQTIPIAVVMGLVLGLAVAFIRDLADDTLENRDDFERAAPGLTLLAMVPSLSNWRNSTKEYLASTEAPASPASEAYRTLRTALQFASLDEPMGIVQFTSSEAGEGKTTTVANLGVQLARADRRVLLVDCDLRRPRLHKFFGMAPSPGFTDVLRGTSSIEDAILEVTGEPKLSLLPAGDLPPNPSELLLTERTAKTLRELLDHADIVLVDTAPILPVADPLIVATVVDGTIFVTRSGAASVRRVGRAAEMMAQAHANVIGTVLNAVGHEERYDSAYGYGYGAEGDQETLRGRWRSLRLRRRRGARPAQDPTG